MNNLVFNTTASQLLTTISNASLTVGGTVTVSAITSPVTIGNTSLTIDGTVTVSNTSLTVAGTVTVAAVSSTVTVAGTVTVGNASITTFLLGSTFTSDAVTSTAVTGTGVVFPDTDISTLKVVSLYLYNEGSTTLTVSLQASPDTTTTHYISDPSYSNVVITAGNSQFVDVGLFAHYFRLQYNLGTFTATFSAFYNAQA
jgi:hypothetical protein